MNAIEELKIMKREKERMTPAQKFGLVLLDFESQKPEFFEFILEVLKYLLKNGKL